MKRKIFVWAVSALLICSAERTNVGVIYSNLGPRRSFDTIDELDILGAGKVIQLSRRNLRLQSAVSSLTHWWRWG